MPTEKRPWFKRFCQSACGEFSIGLPSDCPALRTARFLIKRAVTATSSGIPGLLYQRVAVRPRELIWDATSLGCNKSGMQREFRSQQRCPTALLSGFFILRRILRVWFIDRQRFSAHTVLASCDRLRIHALHLIIVCYAPHLCVNPCIYGLNLTVVRYTPRRGVIPSMP